MSLENLVQAFANFEEQRSSAKAQTDDYRERMLGHMLRYKKKTESVGRFVLQVKPKPKKASLNMKRLMQYIQMWNALPENNNVAVPEEFVKFVQSKLKESQGAESDKQEFMLKIKKQD